MPTEFKLPELGENIESGDLVRLLIKPGASIAEGEPVMELETDKAVVEVPSSVTGTVGEVRVKEGDKLRVGQVIFTVEDGAGAEAANRSYQASKESAGRNIESEAVRRALLNLLRTQPSSSGSERRNGNVAQRRGVAAASRIQDAGTGREHRLRRSGAPDDFAR